MEEKMSVRCNVMKISSLNEFANIRGGINRGCKDVLFVRMLGNYPLLGEDVSRMQEKLQMGGSCLRIREFSKILPENEISYYISCYEEWMKSQQTEMKIKAGLKNHAFCKILSAACENTLRFFRKMTGSTSGSMERNFVVKMLYWLDAFDQVTGGFIKNWEFQKSVKLIAENISKKQEYLFCYLLVQLGMDVILLQYREDIDASLKKYGISQEFVAGDFSSEPLMVKSRKPQKEQQSATSQSQMAQKKPQPATSQSQMAQKEPQPVTSQKEPQPVIIQRSSVQKRQNVQRTSVQKNVHVQPQKIEEKEWEFEELAKLAVSVVMIAVHDDDGTVLGTGSGIMIGKKGYILTNFHVIRQGQYFSVRIEEDDNVYQTDEIIKYNAVFDLAIIRIDRELMPLSIYQGTKKLVRGQKVVAIGSPLGLFNSVSDGIIAGFRQINEIDMIQFTAPISHGSSGGVVLNMFGEVIGISTAGFDDGQNLNLAVGYEVIKGFVRGFTG